MALVAFALLAAAASPAAPAHVPTKAATSATATARILSGAKIRLGADAQAEGHVMKPAHVTVEDGTRRKAQLVEFQ